MQCKSRQCKSSIAHIIFLNKHTLKIKKGGLFPNISPHTVTFPARPPYAPARKRGLALSPPIIRHPGESRYYPAKPDSRGITQDAERLECKGVVKNPHGSGFLTIVVFCVRKKLHRNIKTAAVCRWPCGNSPPFMTTTVWSFRAAKTPKLSGCAGQPPS